MAIISQTILNFLSTMDTGRKKSLYKNKCIEKGKEAVTWCKKADEDWQMGAEAAQIIWGGDLVDHILILMVLCTLWQQAK